jgi:hypothetical protein
VILVRLFSSAALEDWWMHFHTVMMLFVPAFCIFSIALASGVGPLVDGSVTSKYNLF